MFKSPILLVMLMLLTYLLPAQINLNMEKPDADFLRALASYEKGLYNKSIRGFERYLKKDNKNEYSHEADFYIASSKLRLFQAGAISYAEAYLNNHPYSQRVPFLNKEIGDYYFGQKRYRQASRYYSKVDISILDRDETDEFLFKKGYSLFEAEKYDEAKDALYPLTLRPTGNYVKATYYYGYVCYKTKDYKEALKAFLKIEDKGPQTMKLYICQMYYLQGSYQQAIDYANSVNLGKLDDEKYTLMGKSYFRLHNYEKAVEMFDKGLLSYDNLSEDELYEIGYSYYKTGSCNKAFIAFTKIANNGTALAQIASYHMGECFVNKDKKQNAYNAFFEAQRTDFDKEIKENAMYNMAKLAFELEDYKTSISTFNRFLEIFPDSRNAAEAQKKLAQLFLVTTDYKSAIPILESLPNLDAESKRILHQILILRGEELMLNKDNSKEPFNLFTKASNMNAVPMYASIAQFWLGEIAFQQQNKTLATRHYLQFLSSSYASQTPYHVYANYALGYCYFDTKKYTEALVYFNRFNALNKERPEDISLLNDARLRIADCNYSLGNYAAALDNYAYISAKKAASSDYALFQQGMIYGIQNKSNQKINQMKLIIQSYPNSVLVEHALFEIASEWVMLENYKEAERNFRYLLVDFPQSNYVRRSLLALGVMYYSQEKDNEALVEFKDIVSKFPGSLESKNAIGYIERIYVSRGESDAYLAWLEKVPNAGISISFRDSVSYQGAFNLYMNNNCNGAIEGFRKYLQEFPQGFFNSSARFYLATCLDKTNKKEQAIPHYRHIAAGGANEFREESAKRLSAHYFAKQALDSALVFYGLLETFSSDKQNLMTAYLGQVRCAFELNDADIVKNKATRLLRMDNIPTRVFGEVNNKLAVIHYEIKDYETANTHFYATLSKNKDEFGAEAYYFTCQILFDRLFTDQAKARAFEYNKLFSSSDYWQARVFLLLAEIYRREGDNFNARATVNFVVETYQDADIQERAANLRQLLVD